MRRPRRPRDRRPREQKRKPPAGERQPLTREDLAGGFLILALLFITLSAFQVNVPLGTLVLGVALMLAAVIWGQES